MSAKRLSTVLLAALLPTACSSDRSPPAPAGDDTLIVPEGLTVVPLAGGNGVLNVLALTLRAGPSNLELYASLRNDGTVYACSAALGVEFFDEAEQSLGAGIGGLLTQKLFRLTDGSGSIAACVGPGDVTMAALTDLPADIAIENVGAIVYRCPYFELAVEPVPGLSVTNLQGVARSEGTAYSGVLVNGLEVAVTTPSVMVFPLNRVGRPLGVATGSDAAEILPGGRWDFETGTVETAGVEAAAYPTAALAN